MILFYIYITTQLLSLKTQCDLTVGHRNKAKLDYLVSISSHFLSMWMYASISRFWFLKRYAHVHIRLEMFWRMYRRCNICVIFVFMYYFYKLTVQIQISEIHRHKIMQYTIISKCNTLSSSFLILNPLKVNSTLIKFFTSKCTAKPEEKKVSN